MSQKRFLIISGPTGVGESTITKEIIKRFPKFVRLVTATSRKTRLNEKDEVDYYFFSKEEFEKQIENGNIPEHQNTRDGSYYGTYKPDLEKKIAAGYNIIINPDIVGTKYFKENHNATTIFIMPESINSLKQRHLDRDPSVTEEELEARLKYAKYEIDNEAYYYDFTVVNKYGFLEDAIKEVESILESEKFLLK